MTESDSPDRVDDAIAEYLAACDAGRPPERTAFLARYPDLAATLVPFLDDHARMRRAAAPLGPDATLAAPAPTADPVRVKYVGDYELLDEIARGGMGVVFKARQASLNRDVAVKMILAGAFAHATDLARFRLEAEAAANLDHPNVLPVYEIGTHEGRPYFSMKWVPGGTLADRPSGAGDPDLRATVRLLTRVARAVAFAHSHGVLHRDLKPANVLIDADGTPYVADFGLAKKVGSDDGATHTGAVLGTPSYMAPEQARGDKGLTTAVDVYSLGAMLYERLTGQTPFRGETVYDTIKRVIDSDAPDPNSLVPSADRDLAAVAMKSLAKDPAGRYASADAFADDLDRWLAGEPTRARPPGPVAAAVRWLRRNALSALGLFALGLTAGLIAVLAPFTLVPRSATFLVPEGTSPLNPLCWFNFAEGNAAIRGALFGAVPVLVLGGGWLVRAVARPRSTRVALGAGAAVGLVATLVAFSFFGPIFAATAVNFPFVHVHPVESYEDIFQRGASEASLGFTFVPPRDAAYLERFLTDEERVADERTRKRALENLQRRALDANKVFAALAIGWIVLGFLGTFVATWALHGAWAADHLARSARHPLSRALTYGELVVLTLGLALFGLVVVGVTITMNSPNVKGGPMWASRLIPLLFGAAIVAVAHIGVVRGWHPILRLFAYVLLAGIGAGFMGLAGCF